MFSSSKWHSLGKTIPVKKCGPGAQISTKSTKKIGMIFEFTPVTLQKPHENLHIVNNKHHGPIHFQCFLCCPGGWEKGETVAQLGQGQCWSPVGFPLVHPAARWRPVGWKELRHTVEPSLSPGPGDGDGGKMGTSHGNMGIYSGNIIGYIPIYCPLYISPLYPTISISIYIYIYIDRLAVYLPVSSPWLEKSQNIQACFGMIFPS